MEPFWSPPDGKEVVALLRRQCRQQRLEPLWSPVVATGGHQWQIGSAPKARKQAKSVATGCHRLPETFMVSRASARADRLRVLEEDLVAVDLLALLRQRHLAPFVAPAAGQMRPHPQPLPRTLASNP